jgi:hypothetical protein
MNTTIYFSEVIDKSSVGIFNMDKSVLVYLSIVFYENFKIWNELTIENVECRTELQNYTPRKY